MYYKLIRKKPDGKAVHGNLYLVQHAGLRERLTHICETLENADKLVPWHPNPELLCDLTVLKSKSLSSATTSSIPASSSPTRQTEDDCDSHESKMISSRLIAVAIAPCTRTSTNNSSPSTEANSDRSSKLSRSVHARPACTAITANEDAPIRNCVTSDMSPCTSSS